MRFMAYRGVKGRGLATVEGAHDARGLAEADAGFPGHLDALVAAGPEALWAAYATLRGGAAVDPASVEVLPPFARPGKIICVGLNFKQVVK